MLNAIIIAANILAAQPADQRDIAFNIFTDRPYDHFDALTLEYPGLERFWSTDIQGIWFKGTAKAAIRPGDVDGDYSLDAA